MILERRTPHGFTITTPDGDVVTLEYIASGGAHVRSTAYTGGTILRTFSSAWTANEYAHSIARLLAGAPPAPRTLAETIALTKEG